MILQSSTESSTESDLELGKICADSEAIDSSDGCQTLSPLLDNSDVGDSSDSSDDDQIIASKRDTIVLQDSEE